MKLLLKKFNAFWKKMNKEGKFVAQDFVDFMEPAFAEAGYRTPRPRREKPEILIIRDDAAGDFVLFSGVIREIRRLYPAAHITLVVSPRSYELAQACPYIDNLELNPMEYDATKFEDGFRCSLNFAVERLLAHRFDLAFCGRLGIRSGSLLLAYMSGAKRRVAYSQERVGPDGTVAHLGWDCLLTAPVPFPTEAWHDVDMNFNILEHLLQLPIAKRSIEVWYTGQDVQFAEEQLAPLRQAGRRLYGLVPGASVKRKQWPVELYIPFLQELAEREPEVSFVVLGGPGEGVLGDAVADALTAGRVLNLAGRTNFRQAAAVLRELELYIGSDTSLLHIAAALGLPVLTVNCFAMSLKRHQSSIPSRFYPYDVPSVVLLPAEPLDGCKDALRYGCEHENEMHCIRQETPQTMLEGYLILRKRIEEGSTTPLFLK